MLWLFAVMLTLMQDFDGLHCVLLHFLNSRVLMMLIGLDL